MAKPPRGPAFLVHMDGPPPPSSKLGTDGEQACVGGHMTLAHRASVPVQTERRFRSNAKWRPRRLTFTMVQSASLSRPRNKVYTARYKTIGCYRRTAVAWPARPKFFLPASPATAAPLTARGEDQAPPHGPTRGRIDPFLPHQHHTPSSSQSTRVRPRFPHYCFVNFTSQLPPRRHGTRHTRKAQADELLPQILSSMLRRNRGCEFGFQFRRAPMELRF
nr:unnamed protein product [Digitaria exilis]